MTKEQLEELIPDVEVYHDDYWNPICDFPDVHTQTEQLRDLFEYLVMQIEGIKAVYDGDSIENAAFHELELFQKITGKRFKGIEV